jgi:hypothetical protein
MQISHFTALKRIGFKLPQEGFRALCLMETMRSRVLPETTTLHTNLARLDYVVSSKLGLSQSNAVYVDFDTDEAENVPTIEEAANVISTHAQVALALEKFLPGILTEGRVTYPEFLINGLRALSEREVPSGRVVHFDHDFLVIANSRPGGGSIHFLVNGQPAWTEITNFEEMAGKFWPAMTDNAFNEPSNPVLPTTSDDRVNEWVMQQAYVPALEFNEGFDISAHRLRDLIPLGSVVYADPEVVVTTSGIKHTIHFTQDTGRYGVVILDGERKKTFDEYLRIPGLDYLDDCNPARLWIDAAIEERRRYLIERDLPKDDGMRRSA